MNIYILWTKSKGFSKTKIDLKLKKEIKKWENMTLF